MPQSSTIVLGAGCYWGTEKFVKKDFGTKLFPGSIRKATVGFMSPDPDHPKNPSYRSVCSGRTGHVEVLNVELDDGEDEKVLEELLRFFFMFHDPTTANRQGNDVGTQYASAIFVNDERQKKIARKVVGELQGFLDAGKLGSYRGDKVCTAVHDATEFYEAHQEHQEYLMKNPSGYCNHYMRFTEWPESLD